LIELTKAQIIIPETGGAGAGGAGVEPVEPEEPPTFEDVFGALPSFDIEEMEIEIASILAEAERLATQWALDMEAAFSDIGITGEGGLLEAFGFLQDAIDNIGVAWSTGGVVDAIIADFARAGVAVDAFKKTLNNIFGGGGEGATIIRDSWAADFGEGVQEPGGFGAAIIAISDLLTNTFIGALAGITGTLGFVNTLVNEFADALGRVAVSGNDLADALDRMGFLPGDKSTTGLDEYGVAAGDAAVASDGLITALGDLAPGSLLDKGISGFTEGVRTYFENMDKDIPPILDTMLSSMNTLVDVALGGGPLGIGKIIGDAIGDWILQFLGLKKELVGESIVPDMMSDMYDIITDWMEDIGIDWEASWQAIIDFFTTTFVDPLLEAVDGALTDAKTFFEVDLANALSNFKTNILDPLARGLDSVSTAISNMLTWVGNLATAVRNFDIAALLALIGLSPSPLAIGIDYATDAMQRMTRVGIPPLRREMEALGSAYMVSQVAAQPAAGGASNTVSVDMGGVNISNGMDDAMFEARVLNIMKKGLRV
jgi:hypothetical protein